jgi:hypothetical protein
VTDSFQVRGRETSVLIGADCGCEIGERIVVLTLLRLLSILHLLLSTLCLLPVLCLLIILRHASLVVSEAFATGTQNAVVVHVVVVVGVASLI